MFGLSLDYNSNDFKFIQSDSSVGFQQQSMVGQDTHSYSKIFFYFYPNQKLESTLTADYQHLNQPEAENYQKSLYDLNGHKMTQTVYTDIMGDKVTQLYSQVPYGIIKIVTRGDLSNFNDILLTLNISP